MYKRLLSICVALTWIGYGIVLGLDTNLLKTAKKENFSAFIFMLCLIFLCVVFLISLSAGIIVFFLRFHKNQNIKNSNVLFPLFCVWSAFSVYALVQSQSYFSALVYELRFNLFHDSIYVGLVVFLVYASGILCLFQSVFAMVFRLYQTREEKFASVLLSLMIAFGSYLHFSLRISVSKKILFLICIACFFFFYWLLNKLCSFVLTLLKYISMTFAKRVYVFFTLMALIITGAIAIGFLYTFYGPDSRRYISSDFQIQEERVAPVKNKNLILIVADTLRPNALSCYGNPLKTSPNLDMLASQGILFKNNIAQHSAHQSAASIFSSLYSSETGVRNPHDIYQEHVMSFPELLRGQGYQTAAVVGSSYIRREVGYAQGFDWYDDKLFWRFNRYDFLSRLLVRYYSSLVQRNLLKPEADKVTNRAISWIQGHFDTNFFLYLHYADPHGPHFPPADLRKKYWKQINHEVVGGDVVKSLYTGEIEFMDRHIGRLMTTLKTLEIMQDTVVIFAAVCGESFDEHPGGGHGGTLYQEQIHTPLILYDPETFPESQVVETPTANLDLFPTILALLDIPLPERLKGQNLVDVVNNPVQEKRYIFSELFRGHENWFSLVFGDWKYILVREKKQGRILTEELYNLRQDPGEKRPLTFSEQPIYPALKKELLAFEQSVK